jgi:hypothetical protein
MAQAVRRRLLSAEVRVQYQASPREQSGTASSLSQRTEISPSLFNKIFIYVLIHQCISFVGYVFRFL